MELCSIDLNIISPWAFKNQKSQNVITSLGACKQVCAESDTVCAKTSRHLQSYVHNKE